jgi:hypothetical protein
MRRISLTLQVEQILDDWRDYKLSVPTYGAIILNEDLSKVNRGPYSDTRNNLRSGKFQCDQLCWIANYFRINSS